MHPDGGTGFPLPNPRDSPPSCPLVHRLHLLHSTPRLTMRPSSTLLLLPLTLAHPGWRTRRQTNFGPASTSANPAPTNKIIFGLPNIFGGGASDNPENPEILNSAGSGCACISSASGGGVPAPRLGGACNCASSVEFGFDCKRRPQGDQYYGCGCGGPDGGVFSFGRRKRQTSFSRNSNNVATQNRIFNFRCITAIVTGRKNPIQK